MAIILSKYSVILFRLFITLTFLCFPLKADEPPTAGKAKAATSAPILCGKPAKGTDQIVLSAAASAEEESLDLLLETLSQKQISKLITILNSGSFEELTKIEGIAEGRAKTIIDERPFRNAKELMLIKGFGYTTVATVIQHGYSLSD